MKRMAGQEFTHALLAVAGVPALAGVIDGVTGPTNFVNSGEAGANLLYALSTPGVMAAAAAIAASASPEARLVAGEIPIAANRWLLDNRKIGPEPGYLERIQELQAKRQALDERDQELDQKIRAFIDEKRKGPIGGDGPDRGDARYSSGRQGVAQVKRTGRNILGGAAFLGGALGALHAMGEMRDQPVGT